MLTTDHISILARANAILNIPFFYKVIPKAGLNILLKRRAQEIATDDLLLESEGLADLTHAELQIACIRRGLNPGKSTDELRQNLASWTQLKNRLTQISSSSTPATSPTLPPTLLLHLTANIRGL